MYLPTFQSFQFKPERLVLFTFEFLQNKFFKPTPFHATFVSRLYIATQIRHFVIRN